jgi:hypothetical protein
MIKKESGPRLKIRWQRMLRELTIAEASKIKSGVPKITIKQISKRVSKWIPTHNG